MKKPYVVTAGTLVLLLLASCSHVAPVDATPEEEVVSEISGDSMAMPVEGSEVEEMMEMHEEGQESMGMEDASEKTKTTTPVVSNVEVTTAPTAKNEQKKVVFNLTGENFKFVQGGTSNPTLKVKEGDTVVVNFESAGGLHDFKIDEFSAATAKVSEGKSTSVSFVASKKGTFEYYCSVGSHRANGMKGSFIVE